MHRVDTAGAAPGGLFTDGDPMTGTPATVVDDEFLNAVQEEIVGVVEAAGLTPTKGNWTQLLAALRTMLWPETGYLPLPANMMSTEDTEWTLGILGMSHPGSDTVGLIGTLVVPPGLRITAVRWRYEDHSSGTVGGYVQTEDEAMDMIYSLPTGAGGELQEYDVAVDPPVVTADNYPIGISLTATDATSLKVISVGVVYERVALPTS